MPFGEFEGLEGSQFGLLHEDHRHWVATPTIIGIFDKRLHCVGVIESQMKVHDILGHW